MLQIRILQPGDEVALEAFLLPRMDSSMFLIDNSRSGGLMDRGERFQGTYAAAFDRDAVIGVVAHYWNGNLILQAPLLLLNDLRHAAVEASGRAIKGLIGPASQVAALGAALTITPEGVQVDEVEYLYTLPLADLIVPDALASGVTHGRRIEPCDLDTIIVWRVGYQLEAMGERDSPELWATVRTGAEHMMREGRTWILEVDGKPVSMTSLNSRTREAVQVGGVYTPPELRGRGYARCAVAQSLLDAKAEGVGKAILFTGITNTPAQKAYISLGFQQIGDYRILMLRNPVH